MCSWKEQVNLPAQRPPSKLPFARVTFIRVAASQLNWGRGFPGIVGSVSCSCLGEHFLVVVRTWTMWQLRSHARPPRRRLPASALEMLGADLCPAILPLGASVPGGAQRIALSLAARGVALKKPKCHAAEGHLTEGRAGGGAAAPASVLPAPGSPTATFAALRTHDNCFAVLRCIDPRGKSGGTLSYVEGIGW